MPAGVIAGGDGQRATQNGIAPSSSWAVAGAFSSSSVPCLSIALVHAAHTRNLRPPLRGTRRRCQPRSGSSAPQFPHVSVGAQPATYAAFLLAQASRARSDRI